MLDGRAAVWRFGLPAPTTGPDWRLAKPPICSREELDDDRIDDEATEATGRLPGAAGERIFNTVFVVVSLLCGKEENVSNFAPIIKWILPHKPLRGFNEG